MLLTIHLKEWHLIPYYRKNMGWPHGKLIFLCFTLEWGYR